MKYNFAILFLLTVLVSCTGKRAAKVSKSNSSVKTIIDIPNRIVEKSVLDYDNRLPIWTLDDKPYSGYSVVFYPDSTFKEKTGIYRGKKEGQSFIWYADGHLKQSSNYRKGKLHGEKKTWSMDTNHVLISQLSYQFGKPHGVQKKWYATGEIHKQLNLNMGQEEGIQQAFRKNGALYANYEAKEGRIFGLKKASLCFGLENESINDEE